MTLQSAKVTVVIPCYRCSATIRRAISSVAAQTARPMEVVLVDDFSGDRTLEVLEELQYEYGESWIKIISLKKNVGPASARNAGWDAASQPYVAFLDADDAWHPKKIEIQWGWMRGNSSVALSGHVCRVSKSEGSFKGIHCNDSEGFFYPVSKSQLLFSNRFPTSSVMLKSEIPFRFRAGDRFCEDYRLWLDIIFSGGECWLSDLPLAYLFKAEYGDGGLSGNLWRMEKGELDCYRHLYRKDHLTLSAFLVLSWFSLAKFFFRATRVGLRKIGC